MLLNIHKMLLSLNSCLYSLHTAWMGALSLEWLAVWISAQNLGLLAAWIITLNRGFGLLTVSISTLFVGMVWWLNGWSNLGQSVAICMETGVRSYKNINFGEIIIPSEPNNMRTITTCAKRALSACAVRTSTPNIVRTWLGNLAYYTDIMSVIPDIFIIFKINCTDTRVHKAR